jgi:Spy/CpxP family protein refolding chaperone
MGGLPGELNLSEQQREQVRAIFERHQPDMRSAGEKLHEAHAAQQAAISAIPFDESQVRARSADVAAAEAELAVLRGRIQNEVYDILTAEQQTKLRELRAEREQRMKERRDQRRDRRAPAQPPA